MNCSWQRESAEWRESCSPTWSRSREESCRQFASVSAAAALELGD
jgi:hypothetical protein